MKISALVGLLFSQALWKIARVDAGGRKLVEALAAEDEEIRTIAGMLLTKAGQRARPLLEQALSNGRHVPMVISVLGSIGDASDLTGLRPFAKDEDPEVARAARDAIRTIEAGST